MSDSVEIPLDILQSVFEFMLRDVVEAGIMEIDDRNPEQIVYEFTEKALNVLRASNDFYAAVDHRPTLLDRARSEAQAGNDELAVTFYAIWIEHFINGILTRAFTRMEYDAEVFLPLIKELRLHTKASSLWALADLPTIEDENLKILDRILEFRNAFVHYKWLAAGERAIEERDERLREVIGKSEQLVTALFAAKAAAFWNGREKELLEYLHEDLRRRYGETPLRLNFHIDDPGN